MRTIRTVRPFDVEADTIGTLGGYWFVFDGLRRINGAGYPLDSGDPKM